MSKLSWGLILFLLLLSLLGCSSGPNFPVGTYEIDHHGKPWVMEFMDDGEWKGYYDGELYASGTYSISGHQLTFSTDDYCDELRPKPATYTWAYDDGLLTFQLVGEDPCLDRKTVVDNKTYTKQP
jgi:hypothetical protein